MYDEVNPKLLARSGIIDINPKKLKSLQEKVDYEQQEEDMKRHLIGGILGEIASNPMSIDENGYKICSSCHGSGTISDDSWNHAEERESGKQRVITTTTCEACDGAGKVKATEADYEMNRAFKGAHDAGGIDNDAMYDIFMNNKSSNSKS